uniref:hypothetical protein n=1 Tax=Pseudactinotalea sp. TaxID=1926260 RepID=UPI003B3AB8A9
ARCHGSLPSVPIGPRYAGRAAAALLLGLALAGCDVSEAVEPAATDPQTCGTVTSVIGEVDGAFAENLLDTYDNDPPSPLEGSCGFVMIGDWECSSSSSQEPGRASTCHGPDDGLIISVPTADEESAGPVCALIDQPTLEQIFPDGNDDEDLCQSYIDGENSTGG